MKKSIKRFVSLILAVSMLCTMAPAAFALNDGAGAGDIVSSDTGSTITGSGGESTPGSDQDTSEPGDEDPDPSNEGSDGEPTGEEEDNQEETGSGDSENAGNEDPTEGEGEGEDDAEGDVPDGTEPSDPSNDVNEGPEEGIGEIPSEPADEEEDVTIPAEIIGEAEKDVMPIAGGSVVYYVANSGAGGSDRDGDGSEAKPFLTINHAIEQAETNDADDLQIILRSDFEAGLEMEFSNDDMPISFTSDGNYTIQFTGTSPIGSESGFIKVVGGADVSFDGVNLAGSTGTMDGRVIYVADGGTVNLSNMTVSDGRVTNVQTNEGGGGAMADDRGTINIGADVAFVDNMTTAGGGAVFVADGGTVNIDSNAQIMQNDARLGGGVYADTQTNEYGGLNVSGSVTMTDNQATENGSGMYVCTGANASVAGDITIDGNMKNSEQNNVYLAQDATLDIAGNTTGANIGVSAAPEYAYRLVSLPDAYTIQPTVNGDEKGWHDDCGAWDIRHMTYQGVEGLYLYYKTLDMTFEDVNTLTSVSGKDINGENADFLNDGLPSTSVSGGVLTVADTVAKNTPEDDDLVINFSCDPTEYRIPTEDVVKVTSGGNNVAFTYVPNVEAGTATITIDDAVIDGLNDTIKFEITAEKYYTLTVRMEGPLYAMTSSITKLSQDALVVTEQSVSGGMAHYKLMRGSQPLVGATIELYDETENAIGGSQVTDEQGVANFSGLIPGRAYYPIIKYQDSYRVISRDVTALNLSTLEGQNLAADYEADEGAEGHVTYNASMKTASITGLTSDATVTFRVDQAQDTITFIGNEGEATSAPASVDPATKVMPAGADNYGVLATASLTGYTFAGWYTDPVAGELVTSDTPYVSGVSARTLYAHWTANTDTKYTIQHWVEYTEGGVNAGYEEGVTETKVDNGVTYYLYEETPYSDGVSDQVKDITALDLKSMSDEEYTWWTREGFTARFQNDCKVLANGTSKFSVYYDRNTYKLNFDAAGAGSVTSDSEFDPQNVKFGALVGKLPVPVLPGYSFGGWYDGDQLVTATTVYIKTADTDLVAHWNANDNTNWAIKIAIQDLYQDPETGEYSGADTYTEYKTVYKNDDGELLSARLEGTSDTALEFSIDSISALTFAGFNYAGYADAYDQTAANMTADTDSAIVVVKPTDTPSETDGEYNEAFDGGIVWLYYDRKTAHVDPDPSQPGGDTDGGDIVWGGDFTGQLPPDPSKPGYDFDGWEDEDGNPIDENTPADDYVEDDGTIVVYPEWTPRDYVLTYVPGDGSTFVASDGGSGTADADVPGGYQDSHSVTYDQPMGTMPSASKQGYTFDGWFLEDGTQITSETIVTIDNVIIKNDLNTYEDTRVLYAHYTPYEYTLVFHPGESKQGVQGTVDPDRMTVTHDQIISGLPLPELTGYTFVSWMLSVNDPSSIIKDDDTWTRVYTNHAEIPVYAAWIPNTYRYTFDLNDDIGSTKGQLIDTSIGYVDEEFDSVYDGIFEVEAIRPGYDFKGWSLTETGDPLTAQDLVQIAEDTTVYAVWQPKEYDVVFVMKGATMPEGFETSNPGAVYDAAADTWTIKVKFDTTYGELPVPTKTDAEYHGWLANAPHWDAIHNEVILVLPSYTDYLDENGITLTAVMSPLITFDPDGGTFDDGTTEPKKEPQDDIEELPNVSKPGFDFDGWVDEKDPDKILDLDDVLDLDEPTILKPHWSAQVTFNANGGTMRDNGQETLTIGLGKLTEMPEANRSGFHVTGWYTAAEGGSQVTLDSLKDANVPTTVYAHWEANSTGGGGGGGSLGGGGDVPSHIITVEEDEGSTTTPDGKVEVPDGDDQKFEIGAEDGYIVVDVIVDGESVGVVDEYTFENVTEDHTLEIKVKKMLTGDHIAYINGYPDGGVHPGASITRAEVSAIFYRLLTDEARERYMADTSRFSDANNSWAAREIATLTNAGILNGYKDGTFRPNASITRAEYAAIASRFDRLVDGEMRFSDVPTTHWAYDEIASAAEKGWINGYSDGTFRPDNNITRAEAVTLTNAVLERICDEDFVAEHINEMLTFNDLTTAHWAYGEIMEAANAHDYEAVDGVEYWTALK